MKTVLFFYALECLALGTGIYCYRKTRSKPTLYLVYFLAITVFVETVGIYPYFVKPDGLLSSLQGTPWELNYWWYNLYHVFSYAFFITFFKYFIASRNQVKLITYLTYFFVIASSLYLFFFDSFFVAYSPFTIILGTFLIFLSISFYFLELLNSDQVLRVFYVLPFYISVGALIFHLCTAPLFIYSIYYRESIDPEFVVLYRRVIFGANLIMYSIFITGFLICARNRKHS